ncbi:hypothetical protein MTR_2g088955 [Medicago truncatula]|uniref:Uncharacterized protein n=1 Tax=Medicago truncatula TaxID=3880 RepID=A0A072VB58_MEDTR|nr:hypothetical protein MTR_2g088955 [Medicago truncatula]
MEKDIPDLSSRLGGCGGRKDGGAGGCGKRRPRLRFQRMKNEVERTQFDFRGWYT